MTSAQMTENKGKEPSRSDNVVYDYCRQITNHGFDDWLWAMYVEPVMRYEAIHANRIDVLDLSPSPISSSDANHTPADAILRDDEE